MTFDGRALAVIPARGGSKGIPRKNLSPLGGRPLLLHTIEVSKRCRSLDRVIVSTEDDAIAAMARGAGVEVLPRPVELAQDETATEEVLLHVLDHLQEHAGYVPDVVVTLEPTSPLRTSDSVDRSVERLLSSEADAIVSVRATHEVLGTLDDHGYFRHLNPGAARRRQDRAPLYVECGTVYVTRRDVLVETRSVLGRGDAVLGIPVGFAEALDINDPIDLIITESVYASIEKGRKAGGG